MFQAVIEAHQEVIQRVVKSSRGDVVSCDFPPGSGIITALTNGLPDYGLEMAEVRACNIADMGETAFVELMNEIRLSDQILVIWGLKHEDRRLAAMVYMNVKECFTKMGGRAVLVN